MAFPLGHRPATPRDGIIPYLLDAGGRPSGASIGPLSDPSCYSCPQHPGDKGPDSPLGVITEGGWAAYLHFMPIPLLCNSPGAS